jgi:hypothetical protein
VSSLKWCQSEETTRMSILWWWWSGNTGEKCSFTECTAWFFLSFILCGERAYAF